MIDKSTNDHFTHRLICYFDGWMLCIYVNIDGNALCSHTKYAINVTTDLRNIIYRVWSVQIAQSLWLHTNAVAREKSHGIRKDWWKRAQEERLIFITQYRHGKRALCLPVALPENANMSTHTHAYAYGIHSHVHVLYEHRAHRDYIVRVTVLKWYVCCVNGIKCINIRHNELYVGFPGP